MNLDVDTSSPSAKRSRNPTKSHRGKLQKHGPTEEGDNGEEEEEDDEEEQGVQQNGIGEDTAGAEDTKRASSLWQQASRIYRVSRASGGKDRHSKVLTAKGLRDRRIRLSVSTAIQFYDLQDRLGYDQPSKAVDWLIKAASDAISDLPSLDGAFPNLDGAFPNPAGLLPGPDTAQHPPSLSAATNLTRSACSSTSETNRGSLLSLSRPETRVKTREKARERTKDKEKVVVTDAPDDQQGHQPSQTIRHPQHHHPARNSASSFTELLMDCNNQLLQNQNQGFLYKAQNKFAMVVKKVEPPSSPNLDYFSPNAAAVSGFTSGLAPPINKMNVMALAPAHLANATQLMGIAPLNALGFADHHPELQQFALSQQDHHTIPNSNYYNQNFSMSSFSADSIRGTLQSNSATLSHLHHLQKLTSTLATGAGGGSAPSGLPFFIGAAPASTGTAEGQYPGSVFDARLQLCYNDGSRQPTDLNKGKGKG